MFISNVHWIGEKMKEEVGSYFTFLLPLPLIATTTPIRTTLLLTMVIITVLIFFFISGPLLLKVTVTEMLRTRQWN